MMSEQRFRANFDVSIYDSEKEEYISVSERGLEEIAKRMNELQDKITELEIELTDCKNRKEQSEYKNTKLIAKIDFLERVIDGDINE